MFTSPEVGAYIGGPRPRDEFERAMAEVPAWRPGLFVVGLGGAMIGFITLLDRCDPGRPGHVRPEAGEAELGYMFLPQAWGHGYANEACVAALAWFDGALPVPIADVYPLARVREAYTELGRRHTHGKIVLRP